MSCGLGPTDEDPVPVVDVRNVRQIGIRPLKKLEGAELKKGKEKDVGNGEEMQEYVCEHRFHPACLVSAERVAGWGGVDLVKEEKEGEEIEVSCSVCRAVGCVSRDEWDEGACALA